MHAPARLHLLPALAALSVVLLLLVAVEVDVRRQLPGRLEAFASSISGLKMSGNFLQIAAFQDAGMLPVYGSSELDHHAGNRPDVFFRKRPTGFAVFPIGHAGTTCLMILQKVAAVGRAARHRKAVIVLSPSWFSKQEVRNEAVTANLPASQLCTWIFDSPLAPSIKRKIAKRLLDYPEVTENQPLLDAAVKSLAEPTLPHRCLYAAIWLPGNAQNQFSRWIEGCAIFWELHRHPERTRREPRTEGANEASPTQSIDWTHLAEQAEAHDRARADGTSYSATRSETIGSQRDPHILVRPPGSRDADFARRMPRSKEWTDLRLLIEVLEDLGVEGMFISQPFNGNFYDMGGTTRDGRRIYYKKLASVVARSQFPLKDYSNFEMDRFFFNDTGHPSAKAWIYYDQALDQFYHAPESPVTGSSARRN